MVRTCPEFQPNMLFLLLFFLQLYATLDSVALESAGSQKSKENRPPPTEYATLDSLALQSDDSTRRDEDRPKPTEYADIDFLKSKESENTGHPV